MNKFFVAFLALLLTAWTIFDAINDYKSEDKKYIKTTGWQFWLSKTIVLLMFLGLGFMVITLE